MARPNKSGIDYFPLDVRFLRDKKIKLIKAEFGAKGVIILIDVFCHLYEEDGYFMKWDNDDCLLMSDDIGCDITSNLISEVVKGCIKRSVFDERVFNMFGVLTSPAIQRRYLRAVSTRDTVEIFEEYFLLDINNKNDIPEGIRKKIALKKISLQKNEVNLQRNEVDLQVNTQSKVKESKAKDSKEESTHAPKKHKYGNYNHVLLSDTEKIKLENELGIEMLNKCITHLDDYIEMKGYKAKSHYLCIKKWVIDAVKERDAKRNSNQSENNTKRGNYPQRNYTNNDYADMERALVNNVLQGD